MLPVVLLSLQSKLLHLPLTFQSCNLIITFFPHFVNLMINCIPGMAVAATSCSVQIHGVAQLFTFSQWLEIAFIIYMNSVLHVLILTLRVDDGCL